LADWLIISNGCSSTELWYRCRISLIQPVCCCARCSALQTVSSLVASAPSPAVATAVLPARCHSPNTLRLDSTTHLLSAMTRLWQSFAQTKPMAILSLHMPSAACLGGMRRSLACLCP